MKKTFVVTLLAIAAASCNDNQNSPSTRIRRPMGATYVPPPNPNDPMVVANRRAEAYRPVSIQTFNGTVATKLGNGGIVIRADNNENYLLIPHVRPNPYMEVVGGGKVVYGLAQGRPGERVSAHVSWKLPFIPVYLCSDLGSLPAGTKEDTSD